jgi:hypothetical protein
MIGTLDNGEDEERSQMDRTSSVFLLFNYHSTIIFLAKTRI